MSQPASKFADKETIIQALMFLKPSQRLPMLEELKRIDPEAHRVVMEAVRDKFEKENGARG